MNQVLEFLTGFDRVNIDFGKMTGAGKRVALWKLNVVDVVRMRKLMQQQMEGGGRERSAQRGEIGCRVVIGSVIYIIIYVVMYCLLMWV